MSSEHTKEPWKAAFPTANGVEVRDVECQVSAKGFLVARVTYGPLFGDPRYLADTAEANARRIVACVNACEGISTEDLEHYPGMPHGAVMLTAERDQLRSQNAELVEALRDLLERVDRNGGIGEYKGGPAFVTGKARALLARVKP